MRSKGKFLAFWVLSACAVVAVTGQTPLATPTSNVLSEVRDVYKRALAGQSVETRKLDSKLMGREMPYRVIVPTGYDASKLREPNGYPVIYLLHGLTGSYSNWTDRTKLAEYATAHKFIIVTPEGENGWYTDSPTKLNDKYESYIVKELIPQIEKDFRAIPDRTGRIITGLSMGGFGAVKFGLKYPEMFSLVGSFSGAVGASSYRTLEELPPSLQKILVGTFGEPGGDTHKANDLFKIVSDAWPQKIKAMPFIYMSCGTEDFLIQNNRDFLALLNQKRVPHEYREMPGSHDWKFWDDQVREFLAVASRVVKRSAIGSRPSAAGTHRKQLSTIGHQDEGLQNARCVGRLSQADPHTLFAYKGLS